MTAFQIGMIAQKILEHPAGKAAQLQIGRSFREDSGGFRIRAPDEVGWKLQADYLGPAVGLDDDELDHAGDDDAEGLGALVAAVNHATLGNAHAMHDAAEISRRINANRAADRRRAHRTLVAFHANRHWSSVSIEADDGHPLEFAWG
jgi:hypothetical protein